MIVRFQLKNVPREGSKVKLSKKSNYDDDEPGNQIFGIVWGAKLRADSIDSIQVYLREENQANTDEE